MMRNSTNEFKNISLPKTIYETLSEIQDRLGELALKEEKDFDGKEIAVISECYNNLNLMDESLFDAHDMIFKNQLFKFIRTLEDKYFQKQTDSTQKSYDRLDDDDSAEDELLYPDFDLGSCNGICDLEVISDPDC